MWELLKEMQKQDGLNISREKRYFDKGSEIGLQQCLIKKKNTFVFGSNETVQI